MNAPITSGRPLPLVLIVLLLGAALLAGCGGGDEPAADATPAPGSLVPQSADSVRADSTAVGVVADAPATEPEARAAVPQAELKSAAQPSATVSGPAASARRSPALQPSGGTFSLQLGSFARDDYADALVARVRDAGYEAGVEVATLGGQTYHRVVVGGLADRAEAERIGEKLRAALGVSYLVRQ